MEEDEGHAEGEQELCAGRVERDVDHIEDGRAEQHSRGEEDEHARNAQGVGHQMADETRAEHDAEVEHDVLDVHLGDSDRRCGQTYVCATVR